MKSDEAAKPKRSILQAGRPYPSRENGQYVVRLLHLRYSQVGYIDKRDVRAVCLKENGGKHNERNLRT